MQEGDSFGRIVVVARVEQLGDDALCAWMRNSRGSIVAAVNASLEDEAIRHIRQHAASGGIEGVHLCSVDCHVAERGQGRAAAM